MIDIEMEDEYNESENPFDCLFQNDDDSFFEARPVRPLPVEESTFRLEYAPLQHRFIYFLATYSSIDIVQDHHNEELFEGYVDFLDFFDSLTVEEEHDNDLNNPSHLNQVIEWLSNTTYENLFHYHYLQQQNISCKAKVDMPSTARCLFDNSQYTEDCDNSSRLSRSSLPRRLSLSRYLHRLSRFKLDQYGEGGGQGDLFVIITDDDLLLENQKQNRTQSKTFKRFQVQVGRVMSLYATTKVDMVAFNIMAKDQFVE